MFVPTHPTQQMFGAVPLVWICNLQKHFRK